MPILVIVTLIYGFIFSKPVVIREKRGHGNGGEKQCSVKTCGAIDPVSDPAYNMENVIKQSILLEEHLAEKNKYCKDCVCKHYLHLTSLLEEAEMLAGGDEAKYPLMQESLEFYERAYRSWLAHRDDRDVHLQWVTELRSWRKKLMEVYILKDTEH